MFTLIVAVVAVGFFLFSGNLVTTTKMSGKIQKSYTTQDPVLVREKNSKQNPYLTYQD